MNKTIAFSRNQELARGVLQSKKVKVEFKEANKTSLPFVSKAAAE